MFTVYSLLLCADDGSDGVERTQLQEMLTTAAERAHDDRGAAGDATQLLTRLLRHASDYWRALCTHIDNGDYETPINAAAATSPESNVPGTGSAVQLPPLLERAHARKQDAVEAEGACY